MATPLGLGPNPCVRLPSGCTLSTDTSVQCPTICLAFIFFSWEIASPAEAVRPTAKIAERPITRRRFMYFSPDAEYGCAHGVHRAQPKTSSLVDDPDRLPTALTLPLKRDFGTSR